MRPPDANFNHFAGNKEFLGGKIGYTPEARHTFVSVFELPVQGVTTTVAVIILGSEEHKGDVEKLLAWFKSSARAPE